MNRKLSNKDKKDWKTPNQATKKRVPKPTLVNEIQYEQEARYNTNNQELNRVLGGGLVPGSLTLLGGEPGIGKSSSEHINISIKNKNRAEKHQPR